jgi:hypothetical protein
MNLLPRFNIANVFVATAALAAVLDVPTALAATPSELLAGYVAQAGSPAVPARGMQFFTQPHGREWRCSACHGEVPIHSGKHVLTEKPIAPLAPAANSERFTNSVKVEKWFRRNCNDIAGRECTAQEKADILAWLLSFKS